MKGSQSSDPNWRQKKLSDAKGEQETQERCKAILEIIAPGQVRYSVSSEVFYVKLPPGGAALWVYLALWDDKSIGVRIYPGNTMCQARAFFKRARKEAFLDLISEGWQIHPSLALNDRDFFLQTYGNKLSLEQYFGYWAADEIRQIRRGNNGFEVLSQDLRAHRLIDSKDQRGIKKRFTETKRDFMNVCPGFELIFAWRRVEANRLDRDEQFVDAVRLHANEALGTWGQSI